MAKEEGKSRGRRRKRRKRKRRWRCGRIKREMLELS